MKTLKIYLLSLLKSAWKNICSFSKKHPEIYSIPITLVAWALSSTIIWFFDPEAGTFDLGIFQIPLFSIAVLVIYMAVVWAIMRMLFGNATRFLKTGLKKTFNELTTWQKVIYATSIFFALLYILTQLSQTLVLTR